MFTVGVSGTGPFSYQWQFNGTNLPNALITTVAGNGTGGHSGDGGPAIEAELGDPLGLTFDSQGRLYIASDNQIRIVDTNGIITSLATSNTTFLMPAGVAFDAAGNLYIDDEGNRRICKVTTNGTISTFGPSPNLPGGFQNPSRVAVDVAGNVYVSDTGANRIWKVGTNGSKTSFFGPGLKQPVGETFDTRGNFFLSDMENNRVLRVATNGISETVAGKGPPEVQLYSGDGGAATNANLNWPQDLACDAAGNLFIADTENQRIRKVGTNGIITTVAGGGTRGFSGDGGMATNALLDVPLGLAFDLAGNLFLSDAGNGRIREIHFAGDPTLALTNVSGINAGNYSVVISSPSGSVTSSVATLTVYLPPLSLVFTSTNGPSGNGPQLSAQFTGPPGYSYILQSATNLTPPISWQSILTNVTDTNGNWGFTITNLTGLPGQFYRAVGQ